MNKEGGEEKKVGIIWNIVCLKAWIDSSKRDSFWHQLSFCIFFGVFFSMQNLSLKKLFLNFEVGCAVRYWDCGDAPVDGYSHLSTGGRVLGKFMFCGSSVQVW